MSSRDTKHCAEICMRTKKNTKPKEISAMERYKRLVQFFSNPDRTLKDLYPISAYSASETTLDYEEHDRLTPLCKDDRTSGSDYSVSHISSHTRFSRTFGLEDPPSRLELKRRPKRAPEKSNSGTNAQKTNSRSGLTNHTKVAQNVKPTESEKRCLILTSADTCNTKPPSLRSSDSGDTSHPRGLQERTRKRRRSPENSKGSGISQHRGTIIVNRRKSSGSKQFEECTAPLLSSDFVLNTTNRSRVRSPQRPHSSPASYHPILARSSSHGSSKSHSPTESALTFANRLISHSNSFNSRLPVKSQESTRSPTKSRNDTQVKSRHESVSPKSRIELHSKHHEPQARGAQEPSGTRTSSKSHGSLPKATPRSNNSPSPTRTRLSTVSSPDTTLKLTKVAKNIEETFMAQDKNMEELKIKQPQVRKTKKFRKEGSTKNLQHSEEEMTRTPIEKPETLPSSLKTDNVLQNNDSKSSEINTSQSITSDKIEGNTQAMKISNSIFSPLRTSIINTCLGTDNKPKLSTLTNKEVASLLERSQDKQKWTVKSTSSWRSTGSDSTEAESLLDLDKFKQAILSVEMPSEYLEPPQETEIGENIFSVLETISESPLEECAMNQGSKESEGQVGLHKGTSWVNTQQKRKSEQTLSGSEDLSDIQLHYVYGRKSPKDQFQLEWIKLEKVGEDGDAAASVKAKTDPQFPRDDTEDENTHVCSVSLPSTNKAPRVGDADVSQLATFITLPTQSPQSGEDSVVDIIVLREENLTDEQKSAIKRYRSGMIRKNRKKDSSSCDLSQRSGEPIVIPLSDPETNANSTSGYAVLADWPELPLSVDVDVKSWLSKSEETEETESVIFVNRCVSKRSQSTSVWASQTLLDNRSEGNFSETGDWSVADEVNHTVYNKRNVEKAMPDDPSGRGNQSKNLPTGTESYDNHGAQRGNRGMLDNSPSTESVSILEGTNCLRRHLERPKTAPPSGHGMAGLEEIHFLSRKLRSKSSNPGSKSILKRRRHSGKKSLDEQEEVTECNKCSGKTERSFSDLSERLKLAICHHSNSQDIVIGDNKNRSKTAPSSKHRRSSTTQDDDILVLFKPKTYQQRTLKESDRYIQGRNSSNKVLASIKKQSRDPSGGSDRASQVSGSSAQSEKTTCSKKSRKMRPRILSPSCSRKDGDIQLALDSSKDFEQLLRKLNIKHGRLNTKIVKETEKSVSKGTQKDRTKSHQVRPTRETSPLDQRRKISRERSQTPQMETTSSRFKNERQEAQSDFSVEPSAESETSELKHKSEKSPPHLTAYLKTIANLRQKCGKKDCIIGVLLEQLTALPMGDAARKRILEKITARLEDNSIPHRDYSASDVVEFLEMKLNAMAFRGEEKDSESEGKVAEKAAEEEKKEKKEPKEECVCPRDFKIAGSVGCDCLLLTWKSSPRIGEIAGYKVDVDGQLRQHVRSAARTSALLMDLDLSRRMQLALRTQLRAGGEPTCHPPLEIEYEPAPEEDPAKGRDCTR